MTETASLVWIGAAATIAAVRDDWRNRSAIDGSARTGEPAAMSAAAMLKLTSLQQPGQSLVAQTSKLLPSMSTVSFYHH